MGAAQKHWRLLIFILDPVLIWFFVQRFVDAR